MMPGQISIAVCVHLLVGSPPELGSTVTPRSLFGAAEASESTPATATTALPRDLAKNAGGEGRERRERREGPGGHERQDGPEGRDGRSGEAPPGIQRLSRSAVIRLAASQNGRVASARAETLRAEAQMGRVRAARYPEFGVLAFVSSALKAQTVDDNGVRSTRSVYDLRLEDLTAAMGAQITLTQPLYTFGKIDLRGEATAHARAATEATTEMTQADVVIEAVKIYEAHLLASEALRFLEDIEAIATKSVEETEQRIEDKDPDVSEEDLLRLKTGLALARLGHSQAASGLVQSREGLRAYLGLDDEVEIMAEDTHLSPVSDAAQPLERLVAMAREARPEIKALAEGIQGYEKLAQATLADYYPDIFLYGLLSGAVTPGREFATSRYVFDPLAHFLPVALVGARWRLRWDSPSHEADEIRADAAKLAGLLLWAEKGIPAEVTKAHEDVARARRDLAELREKLPLAKQWTVRASADYGVGLGDSRSVSDAVTAYIQLKLAQIDAVYRLNIALAELAKATGTLVHGDSPFYPGTQRP